MGTLGIGTVNERRVTDDQFAGIVKSFSVGKVSGLDGVSDTGVQPIVCGGCIWFHDQLVRFPGV